MSSSHRTVCRFVIRAADGRRSAEWRVWTGKEHGKPKDDLYLAPSTQAIDFKISLHPGTWHGQHGLSDAVREQVRPGDRHALARWDLTPSELFPGWSAWYVIQFPEQELVDIPLASTSPQEIIAAPAEGNSVHVILMVGAPGVELPPAMESSVVGTLDRGNGGKVALIAFEAPFDQSVLVGIGSGLRGQGYWEIPGRRAEPEPFGWVVESASDGTRRSTEFNDLRRIGAKEDEFCLPEFLGNLRPWAEKPTEVDDRGLVCAVLVVPRVGEAELFVDFRARCDHSHLAHDARKLVNAARCGEIDSGWDQLSNGDWVTGIAVARVLSETGGIGDGAWATSPESDDDPGA